MKFLRFSLLFLFIFSCSKKNSSESELIHFIPQNTSIIIKTANLEGFKSSILNNDFILNLTKTNTYKNVSEKLDGLSLLKPTDNVLICFSQDNSDSLQYSVITKYSKDRPENLEFIHFLQKIFNEN